jgi:hypothetical protein
MEERIESTEVLVVIFCVYELSQSERLEVLVGISIESDLEEIGYYHPLGVIERFIFECLLYWSEIPCALLRSVE